MHYYGKGICERCMRSPKYVSMTDKQLIKAIRQAPAWAEKSNPAPAQHLIYGFRHRWNGVVK